MKKFKLIKDYMPVSGFVVETGAIVHLSEKRAKHGILLRNIEEVKEIKKKSNSKKKIENGSNSDTH